MFQKIILALVRGGNGKILIFIIVIAAYITTTYKYIKRGDFGILFF